MNFGKYMFAMSVAIEFKAFVLRLLATVASFVELLRRCDAEGERQRRPGRRQVHQAAPGGGGEGGVSVDGDGGGASAGAAHRGGHDDGGEARGVSDSWRLLCCLRATPARRTGKGF